MNEWISSLRYDPLPFLLDSGSASITFFANRDLLGKNLGSVQILWDDNQSKRICNRQKPNGSWMYPGGGTRRIRSTEDYDQIETYRQLGVLVEEFRMVMTHPVVDNAARFLFAHQTGEGDFRGIYGRQYSPNYTAAMMELLIKSGFGDDMRIEKAFRWLISVRQQDGGWAIPFRTAAKKRPSGRRFFRGPQYSLTSPDHSRIS